MGGASGQLPRAFAAAIIAALAAAAPAAAGTFTLNFDGSAAGTVVASGPGGMTMPQNPVVFNASGNTQSNPNALRRAGNCPDSGQLCTTGDHRIELDFTAAQPARSVAIRVGTVVPYTCFEFDCPTVKLVGYNAANSVVASTPVESVGEHTITRALSIDAFAYTIRKVVYVVSGDPLTGAHGSADGYQYTAQLDDLTYNVSEAGDPPPPPPPAGPSVSFTGPPAGSLHANTDVTATGTVAAPAGVADFCVIANGPSASFPTDCNRTGSIRGDGTWSLFRIPGIRPGHNVVRAWVRDALGRTTSTTLDIDVVDGEVDYLAETIEVTQAIQTESLPVAAVPGPIADQPATPGSTYDGVPLAESKGTIVRLYGAARGAPTPVAGATALLRGYRRVGGALVELSTSPLRPHGSPPTLLADPSIAALRAAADGSFNFVLPPSWTAAGRELVLVGEVAPPTIAAGTPECCADNNRFALTGINFLRTRPATIYAVPLRNDAATPPLPASPITDYFNEMRTVWPGELRVYASLPTVDVTDIFNEERARMPPNENDFPIIDRIIARLDEAYGDLSLRGKIVGLVPGFCSGKGPGRIIATSCIGSKLDFVAHEAGHGLGLAHAMSGNGCSDDDRDGAFDGPLSMRGPINGIGLDPRFWSGGDVGRFKPVGPETPGVFDATPDALPAVYDYMSYCSNEGAGGAFPGQTWVSSGYWATTARELVTGGRIDTGFSGGCCFLGAAPDPTVRAAAAARRGAGNAPVMHVSALLTPGPGGPDLITRAEPDRGTPDAPTGGPVSIEVRRADGSLISSTTATPEVSEGRSDTGSDPTPAAEISATVPSGGDAASVTVGGDAFGSVTQTASANAPVAKLKRPRNGTLLGGKLTAKWKATDADGDPLRSRLEFSADRGRTWRTVAVDLTGTRARVGAADLPRSPRGILQLVVSDGFNVDRSQVTGLETPGRAPRPIISTPDTSPLQVLGDTVLSFEGSAIDDRLRPITGKRLVWESAGERIGTGELISAPVYELGRTVKLTATDDARRRGTAKVKLRVMRVAPLLTTLEAGALSGQARKVKLRVASTLPATLTVSGKGVERERAELGTKPETVKVSLDRKPLDAYALKLKLRADGRTTRQGLTITRG